MYLEHDDVSKGKVSSEVCAVRKNLLEYQKMYSDLKLKIEAGTLQVGEFLPPEPELEKQYGVSRTTVRRAIGMLVADGYITVKQGKGTEVVASRVKIHCSNMGVRFHNVPDITERIMSRDNASYSQPASVSICEAASKVAEALEIAPGENVYRVQRMSFIDDGIPFMYKVNYIRMDMTPEFLNFNGLMFDLYTIMAETYGIFFDHGSETVTAVCADFLDSQLFNIPNGSPLLLFKRKAYTAKGPMEYAEMKLRPEYYEMTVHMNGTPSYLRDRIDKSKRKE